MEKSLTGSVVDCLAVDSLGRPGTVPCAAECHLVADYETQPIREASLDTVFHLLNSD